MMLLMIRTDDNEIRDATARLQMMGGYSEVEGVVDVV